MSREPGLRMLTGGVEPTPRVRYAPTGLECRDDRLGTFIDGKYEVLRQLGEGGMGAIYETRHRTTGRTVAVKVIAPAALARGVGILARFQREARASGSIDSPFVVQTFDAGVDAATGAPYMAMECLVGEDVQSLVARVGPLRPDVVLRICAHACHGLQKAHEAGIVHRDIKSANLFLARRDGEEEEIITKVLDFGIAKLRASPLASLDDHRLTSTGSMLGSPVYMSPEQAIGAKDLDARSDIFSMGVMMYEALTGTTPNGHVECLGALVMAICSQPAPPLQLRAPWVPADVAALVHKALAVNPADRFQSAAELREAAVAMLPRGETILRREMLVALTTAETARRAPRAVAPTAAFVATVLSPHAPAPVVEPHGLLTSARVVPAPALAPPVRRWGATAGVLASLVALLAGGSYVLARRAEPLPERPAALVVTPRASAPATASGQPIVGNDRAATATTGAPAEMPAPQPAALRLPSHSVVTAAPPVPSPARPPAGVEREEPGPEPRPTARPMVSIDRGDPWAAK